jgi:integrase
MSSAHLSGPSWIANFKGLEPGKRRQVRINPKLIPGQDTKRNRVAAQAYAAECERYVSLLANGAAAPSYVDHAEEIGAITSTQAAQLRGVPLPAPERAQDLILTAGAEHPSSKAEPIDAAARHHRLLERFVTWAKITKIDQITIDLVQRWISHLGQEGYAWDSRRHALLWIRRACQMGTRQGIPDALTGFRLDRRKVGDRPKNVALDRAELVNLLAALHPDRQRIRVYRDGDAHDDPDYRPRLAVALGAAMGLRPSETFRLRVGDIDLDRQTLRTGHKNEASIRVLPLPLMLCAWLAPAIAGRSADETVLATTGPRGSRPFSQTTWTQWLGPILRQATARPEMQAKSLRKTFATWTARDRWPAIELEAFLGHESSQVAAITARSYLADYRVDDLRSAALRVDRLLRESIQ